MKPSPFVLWGNVHFDIRCVESVEIEHCRKDTVRVLVYLTSGHARGQEMKQSEATAFLDLWKGMSK